MQPGRTLEYTNSSGAAKAELDALRARARALEAQIQKETSKETTPAVPAAHAVTELWREASGLPSPDEAPRAANHESAITLELTPEEHDTRMGELIAVLQEKGVTKAIQSAEASGNPHLVDDFHRILVEWVREGLAAKQAQSKKYKQLLSLTLYSVSLPGRSDKEPSGDPAKVLQEYIAQMEQLYRGMASLDTEHGEYFSFEIANPAGKMHTTLYIAVPHARKSLFEKQLLSLFPSAKLSEVHDDYNAFVDGSAVAASVAHFSERPIFSLRTGAQFTNDPLDTLLAAFSKLSDREGAAVQWVISPRDKGLLKRYRNALSDIREGVPLSHATNIKTGAAHIFKDLFVDSFFAPDKLSPDKRLPADDPRLKNIERKIETPILLANIRVVASAASPAQAEAIRTEVESAFAQCADTAGNSLVFAPIKKNHMQQFVRHFSYRELEEKSGLPLSTAELATLAHLPSTHSLLAAPELKHEKSAVAPAPLEHMTTGAVLGINNFRGTAQEIRIAPEDRLRHLYVIGQTGTGKSTLLKNLIIQDIRSGAGVCMIDPHGSDVVEMLSAIPPERIEDVIYFDPGSTERPMALNMLEFDASRPEQKTLVVDELLGIFKKLFGAVPESMGPAFEQYFRNAALLVMEDPASGNTLLDITRIFSDQDFREHKLARCKNPIVKQFWEGIASKTSGEQGLENYAPYVTNKFDVFTTNEIVRPIIAQQHSSFNFRDIMDQKKILLVNLSKGRIGDINANLLGLIIVGKFLIAALSRADSVGKDLPPFYLHIDEFQNFTTPSIATILSEARKYKLSLTVAHQFIAQLDEKIRDSVFGNVGSICSFRVGATDAEFLEKQFAPIFAASDLMNVDNRNAYIRLLVGGKPAAPFNIETLSFEVGNMAYVEQMQKLSALKYGRPRAEIEAETMAFLGTRAQHPETLAA